MTERSYKQLPGERGVFFSDAFLRLTPSTSDTPLSLVGQSEGSHKSPMFENGVLFLPYGGTAIIRVEPHTLPHFQLILKYMKERSDRGAGIEFLYRRHRDGEERKLLATLKPTTQNQKSSNTIIVLPHQMAVRVDYAFRSRATK